MVSKKSSVVWTMSESTGYPPNKLFCKLNPNYVISLQGDHHPVTVSYKMSGGKAWQVQWEQSQSENWMHADYIHKLRYNICINLKCMYFHFQRMMFLFLTKQIQKHLYCLAWLQIIKRPAELCVRNAADPSNKCLCKGYYSLAKVTVH